MSLLTTPDKVRLFKPAGSSGGTLDGTLVDDAIAAASLYATGEIGCDLGKATHTNEYVSGDGSGLLMPLYWPITSVTSLTRAGSATEITVLKDGDTFDGQNVYLPAHGKWLEMRGGVWTEGDQNYLLTYVAGYDNPEDNPDLTDLQMAVAMLARLLINETTKLGYGSLTLGQMQVQQIIRDGKKYEFVKETLARYAMRGM